MNAENNHKDDIEQQIANMKEQLQLLKQENESLRRQQTCARDRTRLPSRREIESISSIIDLVNKIDDKTANTINVTNNLQNKG